jgi:hypothetical protein
MPQYAPVQPRAARTNRRVPNNPYLPWFARLACTGHRQAFRLLPFAPRFPGRHLLAGWRVRKGETRMEEVTDEPLYRDRFLAPVADDDLAVQDHVREPLVVARSSASRRSGACSASTMMTSSR